MESLPIDINCNKLLDWLITRRHCCRKWQTALDIIRSMVYDLVDRMNKDENCLNVLDPSDVLYYDIKEMLNNAVQCDKASQNMFGQYTSKSLQDCSEIMKLYEKEGIYLDCVTLAKAETAQIIVRCVNYEIPAIKKNIARCLQTQKECDRKEVELTNSAASLRKKFTTSCRQLSIQGENIETELSSLATELKSDFERTATLALNLKDCVAFYDDFVSCVISSSAADDTLGMLKFVQLHGNALVYLWRTGQQPDAVESVVSEVVLSDECDDDGAAQEIDWNMAGDGASEPSPEDDDNIDFGITRILEGDDVQEEQSAVLGGGGVGGRWGVAAENPEAHHHHSTASASVAHGDDALTVLENAATRHLFIDDLLEVKMFVEQRLSESARGCSSLCDGVELGSPPSVHIDHARLEGMLARLADTVQQLTSDRTQHLCLIRASPRYVDRLCESLRQPLQQAARVDMCLEDTCRRRSMATEEGRLLEPVLSSMKLNTVRLKALLEADISGKYGGRTVSVMGAVNTI